MYINVDSLKELAVFITIIITGPDFESEYLFSMCSVATNLVTSQEFYPLRCATTLSYFERTWTCYVATHFIPFSSTAKNNATRAYVVVPELFGQKAEPASRNEERTRKKLSFVPSSGYEQCRTYTNVNMNFSIIFISCLCFFLGLLLFLVLFFLEDPFDLLFMFVFIVSVREYAL